jgi:hypothetical protein
VVGLELASTLENSSLFEKNPEYKKALQIAAIPERIIQFRVVWEDDKGQVRSISESSYCEWSDADHVLRCKSTAGIVCNSIQLWDPTKVVSGCIPPSTSPFSNSLASNRSSRTL